MEKKEIEKMRKNPIIVSKTRELINRAVIDQQFREELFKDPENFIKKFRFNEIEEKIILANLDERMLRFIQSIDDKISLLSEGVLCTGGPCGIG